MNSQTKICQNCHKDFTIDPEDFQFYEKIKVPPPTFCPECRFQRRLMFWNALNLYKRPCDLCKSFNISAYPPEAPYTVYCPKCWWSDKWDARDYGRDYDFSRPFFEQINELWHEVPLIGLSIDLQTLETSPYNHDCGYLKNCYLLFNANHNEDCAYGYFLGHSQSMLDCSSVEECQSCYDCMHSYRTNNCIGSRHQLSNSIGCLFCRDCQNCQNCFASANLKNKKYVCWNKQLTKEDYFKEISKYDLGSYKTYKEIQARAEKFWKTQIPKSEYNEFATDCTGSNIFFSKNVRDSIEILGAEDSRYLFRMWGPNKNCYDISMWGVNLSFSYDSCVVGENSDRMLFCKETGLNSSNVEYSTLSVAGNHNFGCASLKKGNYMIFNKRYPKENFEKLRSEIIKQMNEMPFTDRRGNVYKYGEFFPPEMSPFEYNETLAMNFFPMREEEILGKGYRFREVKSEEGSATMDSKDIPDNIKETPDSILTEKISCENCGKSFQIIGMEMSFLKNNNLPLPRKCPFCRINEKVNIWVKTNRRISRTCADCGKQIESKYDADEAREVFCRSCYISRID